MAERSQQASGKPAPQRTAPTPDCAVMWGLRKATNGGAHLDPLAEANNPEP